MRPGVPPYRAFDTDAFRIRMRSPLWNVKALGYGSDRARTRLAMSFAGQVQSMRLLARSEVYSADPVVYRTRNLVFWMGLEPRLPDGMTVSGRIWHNHNLLADVDRIAESSPTRFVVVGAGQSAAETTAFLHRRFPAAEVCSVFSR